MEPLCGLFSCFDFNMKRTVCFYGEGQMLILEAADGMEMPFFAVGGYGAFAVEGYGKQILEDDGMIVFLYAIPTLADDRQNIFGVCAR